MAKRNASSSPVESRGKQPREEEGVEMLVANYTRKPTQPYGKKKWVNPTSLSKDIDKYSLLHPQFKTPLNRCIHYAGLLDLDLHVQPDEPLFVGDENPTPHDQVKKRLCEQLSIVACEEELASICRPWARLLKVKKELASRLRDHKIPFMTWFTGLKGYRFAILDPALYSITRDGYPQQGTAVYATVLKPFLETIGMPMDPFAAVHDPNVHDWNKGVKTDLFPHPVSGLYPHKVGPGIRLDAKRPHAPFKNDILSIWKWITEHLPSPADTDVIRLPLPGAAGPMPLAALHDMNAVDMNPMDPRFALIQERVGLHVRDGVRRITRIKIVQHGPNPPQYTLLNQLDTCTIDPAGHSSPGKGYLELKHGTVTHHCHTDTCKKKQKHALETHKLFSKLEWALLFADTDAICTHFNKRYALLQGTRESEIVDTEYINPITKTASYQRISLKSFRDRHRNVIEPRSGLSSFDIWLAHPHRRTFTSIVFDPSGAPSHDKNVFNTWKGFDVDLALYDPDVHGLAKCARILRHFKEVLAHHNAEMYEYLLNYCAQLVQFPHVLPRVALVLMGREGAGKGMLVDILSQFISNHVAKITNNDHATSGFNSFMEGKLLVFFDESFFAGNQSHRGQLYGYITEEYISIRQLYHDLAPAANVARIIISSNHTHVIPAGETARRFAVLDINPQYETDLEYFNALTAEIADPDAILAFFHFLKHRDLSGVDLRQLPAAGEALLWQNKYQTMDSVRRWFYESLKEGTLKGEVGVQSLHSWPLAASENGRPVPATLTVHHRDIVACYMAYAATTGIKHKEKPEVVIGTLKTILLHVVEDRKTLEKRPHGDARQLVFPPLHECRRAFEKEVKTTSDTLWE